MWGCARRCCPNAPTMVYKCAWHSAGARGGPLPTRGIVPVLQTPAPRPAQEGTASVPRMLTPSRQIDSQPLWGRRSGRFLCLWQRFPAKTPSGQPVPGPKKGPQTGAVPRNKLAFSAAGGASLLYTVAALAIPASDKAEITAAASKAGRFLCLRQRFPAFHITRWKTLCIMWKTSCYVILWKSCENFTHPLCTAKVLSFRPKTDFSTKEALYDPYH